MPTEPRLNHFLGFGPHGFHRVAYTEWGNPEGRHLVVCVHGLTRNSRDFDELAASLSSRGCRVVCMDVVGRGDSDWLEHKEDYGFAQYLSDSAALLAQLTSPRGENGAYPLACDPAIVSSLRRGGNAGVEFGNDFLFGVNLWPVWDTVECPTLVLRGAESDLLLKSTVRRMQDGGPRVELVEFAGIGHAPWLMSEDQIGPVSEFILAPEPLRR